MATSRLLETTFVVPNLHCPTCTSHIQHAVAGLQPRPESVSTSIISHTVTIKHRDTLSVSVLSKTLDEAGFEVFDVVQDPFATHGREEADITEHGIPAFAFEQAMQRWIPSSYSVEDDEKRLKHVKNCELCRSSASTTHPLDEKRGASAMGKKPEKLDIVVQTDAKPPPLSQVTLAVEGMTCSSCVGSVTNVLEGLPWVRSASVNLLTNSAIAVIQGDQNAEDLVEALEDAGFGASVQHVEAFYSENQQTDRKSSPTWEATFSIEGMTCSSCVNSISSAVKQLPWIQSIDVNLLTHSASAKFSGDGKDHADAILSCIEEIGFDAKLENLKDLTASSTPKTRRHVAIDIRGMYCEHCPPKAADALALLSEDIAIERHPSTKDPIMRISYIPNSPNLTIRHILRAIEDSDPDFRPVVHKPISLEERSKRMQKREQWHMLYRFTLSLAAAIPSLIIGIVYMSLVSPRNSGRRYLEERLHGVSRAEWSLFIIATPVYFFAADVFHRRTLKELRALWRTGSRVPLLRRFYRFGSMNMLISFGTTVAYFASIAEVAIAATHTRSNMSMDSNSTYFDSVVFLTMFLLLGRLIEAYSKAKSGNAVAELGKLRPVRTLLISDDGDKETLTEHLEIGDVVRIPNGGSPPFDGVIVNGESIKFDESSLTGESRLVSKDVGDEVFSGTINKGSPAAVRLIRVSGDSMLDQIINVVREGQARRAPVERVADAITGHFVPFVTFVAVCTWIVWLALGTSGTLPVDYLDTSYGGWPFWSLKFAIAVFVVAWWAQFVLSLL